MKTVEKIAEEMLERYTDTLSISDIVDDIVKIREEAYNQAIEDAIGNVTLSLFDYEIGGFKEYKIKYSHYIINDGNYIEVDKDSILKLKK